MKMWHVNMVPTYHIFQGSPTRKNRSIALEVDTNSILGCVDLSMFGLDGSYLCIGFCNFSRNSRGTRDGCKVLPNKLFSGVGKKINFVFLVRTDSINVVRIAIVPPLTTHHDHIIDNGKGIKSMAVQVQLLRTGTPL